MPVKFQKWFQETARLIHHRLHECFKKKGDKQILESLLKHISCGINDTVVSYLVFQASKRSQ